MVAGQALSFAPDYHSAKVSAGRLFKLFDTKSQIDVNEPGGKIKVCPYLIFSLEFLILLLKKMIFSNEKIISNPCT